MTFDLDIWQAGSTWPYLCQGRISRSYTNVPGHRRKHELSKCWGPTV